MRAEVARLLAEHGLRGAAAHYTKELRGKNTPEGTIVELQHSLRSFLRWLYPRLGLPHGARVDPSVLSVPLLHEWWAWMLSPNRVHVYRVRRHGREYERTRTGPLAHSSAYKEWTSIVAFWRWGFDVDEFEGAFPRCPTQRLKQHYVDRSGPGGKRRVEAATWEEAAACVAEVADWVRPLAILCYYTGLRVQQARSVVWGDIHLDDAHARRHGGPVLWVGHGKTKAEHFGRFLPLHPSLVEWLRQRRKTPGTLDALERDLRRTESKAYKARINGLAEGRIAWEVGDQNVSLQLSKAWDKAGVAGAVWEGRTAHAFRKALRTNVMDHTTEPGARLWQATEALLGHGLPGQLDVYQAERALMTTMRALIESIPPWEDAVRARKGKVVQLPPRIVDAEDLEALG